MREKLKTALDATELKFAHFGWSKAPSGDYGVFAEDGENAMHGDQLHAETAMRFTVDYFTRSDSDTIRTTIEAVLEPFAWYLNSVQFEDDTGFVHYEWIVEVV